MDKKILRSRESTIFFFLILLCILISVKDRNFISTYNLQNLIRDISFFSLIAFGEALVIISGGIDLSVGSVAVLCDMFVALLLEKKFGIEPSITFTLLLACSIGYVHGLFVTKLKVPPFVITLGTLIMARAFAAILTQGRPISDLPKSFEFFGGGDVFGIPFPAYLFALSLSGIYVLMQFTPLGRYIYSVGGNIQASRLSGVDVNRVRIFCYVVCSFGAGLTGILFASLQTQGNPNIGVAYELIAIAACVIGGISLTGGEGSVIGPVLGTSIMLVLRNGLIFLDVSSYWHDVVIGTVLVLAVTMDMWRKRKEIT